MARPADSYSPLYLLAALGAGGAVVTFFLWFMFWIPHPGQQVPVHEDILAAWTAASGLGRGMIATGLAAIALLVATHLALLVWNLPRLGAFRRGDAGRAHADGPAAAQLMSLPLTLAMTINAGFIAGLVFVPRLWSVVEYLFPFAIAAFLAVGTLGLSLYARILRRIFGGHPLPDGALASFGQVLPAFAFSMVAVGLAAPASMSATPATVAVSLVASAFFGVLSVAIAVVTMTASAREIARQGIEAEMAPTLVVGIPLLTVLGIALLRWMHGLHLFGAEAGPTQSFTILAPLVALQLVFAYVAIVALRQHDYMRRFVTGRERSPGAFALLCGPVALSVSWQFLVNNGLVGMGAVAKFGVVYWALTSVAVALQVYAVWLLVRLVRNLFETDRSSRVALSPAE